MYYKSLPMERSTVPDLNFYLDKSVYSKRKLPDFII